MNRTTLSLVIVTSLGAGLYAWTATQHGSTPDAPVAQADADADAPRITAPWRRASLDGDTSPWRIGASRRYAVETMSEVELGGEESGQTLFFGIEGEMTLTVVQAGDQALELRGLVAPKGFSFGSGAGDTGGKEAEAALRANLARPFHLTVDASGRVAGLRFAPGTDSMSMGIVRSILTTAQFVQPDAGAREWQVLEQDGMGEYEARYVRTGDGAFTKTKGAYVRVSAETGLEPAGPDAPRAALDARFSLGAAGEVVSLEAEQSVGRQMGDLFQASGKGRLTMSLLDRGMDTDAVAAWKAEAGLFTTMTASQVNLPANADRQHWTQLLGGATLPELLASLRAFDVKTASTDARLDLMTQLTALLALEPDAAAAVLAEARGLDAKRAGIAISALSNAGTPQAQAALVTMMNDSSVEPALREKTVQLLGMSPNPTDETASAVEAMAREEGELGNSATLAMGNVADGLGRTTAAAQRLIAELERRLHAARTDGDKEFVLVALGNTASPLIVDIVKPYLADPTPEVRLAAVGALRLVSDLRAHELIAGALLSDADAAVRAKAAQSMDYVPVPLYLDASARCLGQETDAHVRKQVVIVVAARFAHIPAGQQLLAQVRAGDPDAEVRAAATPSQG